jgi:NADP-dependent 3-hydroxy acid dehydrogenase YdfG
MPKPLIAITGASSGIGAETAKLFSEAGYPLLLMARRLDRLDALNLPNTQCRYVDVTNTAEVKNAIERTEEQFGPVDCLINNAGVMLLGLMHEQNPDEWKQMFDVNVMGLLNGIHAVLPGMIQRKTGTIINVSSIAGRKTFPAHAAYCGTKFAVHAISENLREEVAPHNVRVITIAPGAVETELLGHTTSDAIKHNYENWKNNIGGALNSKSIAAAILFAYQQPQNVCVREVVVAATRQEP